MLDLDVWPGVNVRENHLFVQTSPMAWMMVVMIRVCQVTAQVADAHRVRIVCAAYTWCPCLLLL